jgi:hypothetical protein
LVASPALSLPTNSRAIISKLKGLAGESAFGRLPCRPHDARKEGSDCRNLELRIRHYPEELVGPCLADH